MLLDPAHFRSLPLWVPDISYGTFVSGLRSVWFTDVTSMTSPSLFNGWIRNDQQDRVRLVLFWLRAGCLKILHNDILIILNQNLLRGRTAAWRALWLSSIPQKQEINFHDRCPPYCWRTVRQPYHKVYQIQSRKSMYKHTLYCLYSFAAQAQTLFRFLSNEHSLSLSCQLFKNLLFVKKV